MKLRTSPHNGVEGVKTKDAIFFLQGILECRHGCVVQLLGGREDSITKLHALGSLGVSAGRFRRGIRKLAVKEGLNIRVKPFLFKWWEKIPGYLEGGDPLVMLFVSPFKKITVEYPDGWKAMCDYHWVTITEMDGDTLWVSSWGERCRMSVKELKRFGVILRFYSVSLEKQSDIV